MRDSRMEIDKPSDAKRLGLCVISMTLIRQGTITFEFYNE